MSRLIPREKPVITAREIWDEIGKGECLLTGANDEKIDMHHCAVHNTTAARESLGFHIDLLAANVIPVAHSIHLGSDEPTPETAYHATLNQARAHLQDDNIHGLAMLTARLAALIRASQEQVRRMHESRWVL